MPKSESRTTSSSDTTERPGDLNISGAPYRKGTYLYVVRGSVHIAVARFMNERAVEIFKEWAKAVSGATIQWSDDDVGEGESPEA